MLGRNEIHPAHIIGRIGEPEVGGRPVHQRGYVVHVRRIAAHQKVIAEVVDPATYGITVFRNPGHGVGFGFPRRHGVLLRSVQQPVEFVGIEAKQGKVEVGVLKLPELQRQEVVVPLCNLGGLIVRDPVGPHLFRSQVVRHKDGNLLQPEPERRLITSVTGNDNTIIVHNDRASKPEFPD